MRLAVLLLACTAALAQSDFEARVVEDSSGNPLASAEVRFHKIGVRELAADLDTNREGIVRASGLPPGEYTISIAKPNYVTASLKVKVPATGVLVRLVRYAIFSGQVIDSQGRPALGRISAPGGRTIGGARITILAKTDAGFRKVREVALGEEGTYRIHDLPPGEYTVALWYDGLKDGSGVMMIPDPARPRIFTVAGGEEFRDIDFQLVARPAFQVTGTVQLPKPKTRIALALGLPEQPLLPIAQFVTNGQDGAFKFERVPAGTYDLFVAGPDEGYGANESVLGPEPLFARTRIHVTGADVTGLDLSVAPGRTLAVKLAGDRPQGCPASVPVTAELLEPWGVRPSRPTQVSFGKEDLLRHLTPGRVRLNAGDLGPNCFQPEAAIIDLSSESGPAAVRLAAAGSIRGVLRAGAAKPAAFTVVLLENDSSTNAQARLAEPDADGKFAFDSLPPGRYRIAARPRTAEAKSRWVADISRMIEIQIPGGVPTDIELPAPPPGGRQ
jgi:hypothetical protein